MTESQQQLLTLQRVAELLDAGMDFVYELTAPATRILPVVYIGPRSPRVRMSDLQAFIDARIADARPKEQL